MGRGLSFARIADWAMRFQSGFRDGMETALLFVQKARTWKRESEGGGFPR
jgi:hypothetical protein